VVPQHVHYARSAKQVISGMETALLQFFPYLRVSRGECFGILEAFQHHRRPSHMIIQLISCLFIDFQNITINDGAQRNRQTTDARNKIVWTSLTYGQVRNYYYQFNSCMSLVPKINMNLLSLTKLCKAVYLTFIEGSNGSNGDY